MSAFSAADSAFMARALRLAAKGRYTAHPNPMVGCVLVANNQIIGEGWHELAGDAHAEINALRAAGDSARGATAYVTLEPCAHHGKTPPCAEALLAAGVEEVVVALEDPYKEVDGRGLKMLRDAGVVVRTGLMQDQARQLLESFIRRVTMQRPLTRVKVAASLDGGIAMANGQSQWITGPEARADVQRLRAASGAIMTGIGTVLADDPSLTVREPAIDMRGRQPIRVVLDSSLRMPVTAKMLALPGATLVYCGKNDDRRGPLNAAGADVAKVTGGADGLNLVSVLEDLAARGVNDVLVEAGPRLAGSLLEQKLVDEIVIYQAPQIMGSETMRMFTTPTWRELNDRATLTVTDMRRIGNDLRMTFRIANSD